MDLKSTYMETKAIRSAQEQTDMRTKDLQMHTAKLSHERTMIATQTQIEERKVKQDEKLEKAATKAAEEAAERLRVEQQRIADLKQRVAQLNLQRSRAQDQKEELVKSIHESRNQLKHIRHQIRTVRKDKDGFFDTAEAGIAGPIAVGDNYQQCRAAMLASRT